MTKEDKKSKKELREEAENMLEKAEHRLENIKQRIKVQEQIRDAVLAGFEPTEKYLENADFMYQKSDEYIEANRQAKVLAYQDAIEELEDKKQTLVDYIPDLKKQIKENRG